MTTHGAPSDSLWALARKSDPRTSHDAAATVDVAGDEAYALACIRESGGLTAAELERKYRVGKDGKIRKRLAGLHRKGLIRYGITRHCNVGGRVAITYWATEGK